jgi:hypothetical protein
MKAFLREFNEAARQGPRIYFAPLVGAIKAIQVEIRRPAVKQEPRRQAEPAAPPSR